MVNWSKSTPDRVDGSVGPFVAHVTRKGDGRWDWKIYENGADSPLAAGVSVNIGAAKAKCDQFVSRSGKI